MINTSWLAAKFPQTLGDGSRWGLRLHYSYEGETAARNRRRHAGTRCALLGDAGAECPFLAVNGDIWTRLRFRPPAARARGRWRTWSWSTIRRSIPRAISRSTATAACTATATSALTFAGIGVYRPSLFDDWRDVIGDAPGADDTPPRFKLAPLLRAAMARSRVSGEHHRGRWTDVGTPQRLAQLDQELGTVGTAAGVDTATRPRLSACVSAAALDAATTRAIRRRASAAGTAR